VAFVLLWSKRAFSSWPKLMILSRRSSELFLTERKGTFGGSGGKPRWLNFTEEQAETTALCLYLGLRLNNIVF
jgi:hypothetical protein